MIWEKIQKLRLQLISFLFDQLYCVGSFFVLKSWTVHTHRGLQAYSPFSRKPICTDFGIFEFLWLNWIDFPFDQPVMRMLLFTVKKMRRSCSVVVLQGRFPSLCLLLCPLVWNAAKILETTLWAISNSLVTIVFCYHCSSFSIIHLRVSTSTHV